MDESIKALNNAVMDLHVSRVITNMVLQKTAKDHQAIRKGMNILLKNQKALKFSLLCTLGVLTLDRINNEMQFKQLKKELDALKKRSDLNR